MKKLKEKYEYFIFFEQVVFGLSKVFCANKWVDAFLFANTNETHIWKIKNTNTANCDFLAANKKIDLYFEIYKH